MCAPISNCCRPRRRKVLKLTEEGTVGIRPFPPSDRYGRGSPNCHDSTANRSFFTTILTIRWIGGSARPSRGES
jgi:hypothetical protein